MVKKHFVLAIVLSILLLVLRANFFLDPDLGWHIKTGELIRKDGIPRTDPFSYSMKSFPVISHEWLTDIALSYTHTKNNNAVQIAIFTSIALLALLLSIQGVKNKKTKTILLLISLATVYPYFGIRPQILSWLYLAILIKLLDTKKAKYAIPLLFIAWINTHGSFIIGFAVLAVKTLANSLSNKKTTIQNISLLTISLLTIFINPYGLTILEEVMSTAADNNIRLTISEWMPSLIFFNPSYMTYIALTLAFVSFYFKKTSKERLLIFFFLFSQAILSRRHVPLFIIGTLPFLADYINMFENDIKKIDSAKKQLRKLRTPIAVVLVVMLTYEFYTGLTQAIGLSENTFYPKNAVTYLTNNPTQGEVFTAYSWGGYFIFNLNEKKVYIDGRMPSWKQKTAPDTETTNAFLEYKEVLTGKKETAAFINKYNIETIVWPAKSVNSPDKATESDWKFLSIYLKENNWQKTFEDNIAIIYQKK